MSIRPKLLEEIATLATGLTDEGLKHLVVLKKLVFVYKDHTRVTEAGKAEMRQALPGIVIVP